MCESTLYLEEGGQVHEKMREVARIVFEGDTATVTDVVGERIVLEHVEVREINFLSHGVVLRRLG
jgi:predicted RNA-binding protein